MGENIYEKIINEQLIELESKRKEIAELKKKESILKSIGYIMLSGKTLISKHDEIAEIIKENLSIFLN